METREMKEEELQEMLARDQIDRGVFKLSADNIGALRRYIDDRIEPGSFVMAVLCNDLKEACGRADMYNRRKLFEYVEYLYNKAPSVCWGSREKVTAWLNNEV